jgi:aminoglycoside phosphotransferase (APT) family kinase protein
MGWCMNPPWTVSRDLARMLIETRFPQFRPARVESLGPGWDNTAFCVNESWVFRFPRRQAAVPFMEAEMRLLPALAPRLALSIPSNDCVGRPTEGFPCPFAGYPLIPG